MLKFWALSGIAAFCLKGVVSIDYGSQAGGSPFNIPGGMGIPGGMRIPGRPTERVDDPKKAMPLPQIGDDKIRIVCTSCFLIEFFIRSFDRGV